MLQLALPEIQPVIEAAGFKPHQRGGGCCSYTLGKVEADKAIYTPTEVWELIAENDHYGPVSNPISGEVGAAAEVFLVLYLNSLC